MPRLHDKFVHTAHPAFANEGVGVSNGVKVELTVCVGKGKLTYYRKSKRFAAYCRCDDHVGCRIMRPSWHGFNDAQGRPLGLMYAWLEMGDPEYSENEVDHKMLSFMVGYEKRCNARERLKLMGPIAQELLSFENPANGLEPIECA